jgi:hypothetical protein
MDRGELLRLARAGAEARLTELRAETDAILLAFPELRGGRTRAHAVRAGNGQVRRRRSGMSAAARKRIGLAQKRRWAQWRKERARNG